MREIKNELEFNDDIFLQIASNLGIAVIRETIEAVTLDKEESGLESVIKDIEIPEFVLGYAVNLKDSEDKFFGVYLDSNNRTISGIIAGVIVNLSVIDETMYQYLTREELKLEEIYV
ncbi:MAG: hypothetical protein ACRC0Y_04685 [Fusobacteriaceae bacterium]